MPEELDAGGSTGPQPVGPDAYRQALARFATGVAVATTYADGLDYAMTVTAFTSVSLAPPLVLVCVEKRARFHDAVLKSGRWAVSILGRGATEVSDRLARRGRPLAGQLDGIAHERGVTKAALLVDAIARLECRTWATYEGGDHTIVVGEVVVAEVRDDTGDPESGKSAPLVHFRGTYGDFCDV